jgi:hypothetical protein
MSFFTNLRAKYLQMPYGDQALFMTRRAYDAAGGIDAEQAMMEDFTLVRRLQSLGRVHIAAAPIQTSARRWLQLGVMRTMATNQLLVLGYSIGVPAATLKRWYYGA